MSTADLQHRLRVTRQRADQLTRRPDFPEPFDRTSGGRVWLIGDIDRWISDHRPEETDQQEADSRPGA